MKSLLGKTVVDTISGFKGVVVAEYIYINGCTRCCVQPKVDKDGKLPDTQTFDLPQLEVQKEKKFIGKLNTGGPDKYIDKRKY